MNKNAIYLILFLFNLFIITSCNSTKESDEIEFALVDAGSNRNEILKVLRHYRKNKKDSLKLKAAVFLIKNMKGLYHYNGKLLDNYAQYQKLIRADSDHGEYFMESLDKLYRGFSLSKLDIKYDLETLSYDEIIENIEMAFKVWREKPWGKNVNFEMFCEYILPFKTGTAKPFSRLDIYDIVQQVLSDTLNNDFDVVMACKSLNERLMYPNWILTQRIAFLPSFAPNDLIKYRVGTCREMADLALYVMRANGIPVAIDFLPQWPYRSIGHFWNVVFDKEGKSTMFLGADDSPGTPHKPNTKKGKVFRYLYSYNPLSLAMQVDRDEVIPPFMENKRIKDVSEEYFTPHTVNLELKQDIKHANYAYLAVFDNRNWVPIHWGKIKDKKVSFLKMEDDIVYLPCLYQKNGVTAIEYPILLTESGAVKILKPDSSRFHKKITLDRIAPIFPELYAVHRLKGGVFQGANHKDFSDAVTLDSIDVNPMPYWNEVNVNNKNKFRYVRYLSAPKGHCFMGEMEFYGNAKKLNGKLIGTLESWDDNPEKAFDKTMDGDVETHFDAKEKTGAWAGLELSKPAEIHKIRFSAAVDNYRGKIIIGNEYLLSYFKQDNWVPIGKKKATENEVSFENLPESALYRIVDLSEQRDSRIFTIDNGMINWR